MIASISFDYFSILKNAKKVSKRNPLSSKNIKYLKKFPFICFGTGLIVAVFVWLCTLVGIVSGSFSILESLVTAILVFLLVSFFSFRSLSKKIDIKSYKKLKRGVRKEYQIMEYCAKIDGFYDSIGVSTETNVKYLKDKKKSKTYIMILDGQKVYLNSKVYDEIKEDKKINIYFIKAGNTMVFYDYGRIKK